MNTETVFSVLDPDGYVVGVFAANYMAEEYVTDRLKEQGMSEEDIAAYREDFQVSEVPLYGASLRFN